MAFSFYHDEEILSIAGFAFLPSPRGRQDSVAKLRYVVSRGWRPRQPEKNGVTLLSKRATNGRPYKRISNILVGASIARPHKNDVTFLLNGGSKPPPYGATFSAHRNKKTPSRALFYYKFCQIDDNATYCIADYIYERKGRSYHNCYY